MVVMVVVVALRPGSTGQRNQPRLDLRWVVLVVLRQ